MYHLDFVEKHCRKCNRPLITKSYRPDICRRCSDQEKTRAQELAEMLRSIDAQILALPEEFIEA